jgi:hypothetical protein
MDFSFETKIKEQEDVKSFSFFQILNFSELIYQEIMGKHPGEEVQTLTQVHGVSGEFNEEEGGVFFKFKDF